MGCFGSTANATTDDGTTDDGTTVDAKQTEEKTTTIDDILDQDVLDPKGREPIDVSIYKIGRTLGSGASCRVVVGVHKNDESNQVAIKIMEKDKPIMEKLFVREVNILSRLCPVSQPKENMHKNILQFEGHQEDQYSYFIVTKLLEGGELFDRIVSKDTKYIITEKVAALLIRDMLTAVKYCHDNNIVHRDLKPENFVFANKEVNSDIVLIDYGCARIVKDTDVIEDVVGTAYYLAPELACVALENFYKAGKTSSVAGHVPRPKPRTGKILKATDLWSMGVIAYVMMTGRAPFRGRDNQEIFESICIKELAFPEKDARYQTSLQLSEPFKDFVRKVLVKDPAGRISIEEAIRHPWVQGIQATDYQLNKDVIQYLRQFNYQSKLKKEITRVLAANMTQQPEEEIRRHFKRLDADGDGFLDADELKLLLLDMGYAKHEAYGEAVKMVQNADLNKDGKVDFEEFKTVWYRKVLSSNQQYVRRVFCVFDDNGDGHIDAAELQAILFPDETENKNDAKESDKEDFQILESIHHMIEEVDENGDHVISFEEFERAMKEDMDDGKLDMRTLMVGGKIE